jgi:hypothetical protein
VDTGRAYENGLVLLAIGHFLTGSLCATAAGQSPWYFHVKTGGTGGKPVQSEADPDLASCWNSINEAFLAVKSGTKSGPWVIQVDDEATYDEAVVLSDLQTSSTETLTVTKALWLAGRPTIYPSQPNKRALAINGLWPGTSGPLPGQPDQASRRVTCVTVRGFTLKNNVQGPNNQPVFTDNQIHLTEGLHIIEDCQFDGQNQVYNCRGPIDLFWTCINTVIRRSIIRDFIINEELVGKLDVVFVATPPGPTVTDHPSRATHWPW